jgi:AraC family transcriptional regulator
MEALMSLEAELTAPGISLQTRHWHWPHPSERVMTQQEHALTLSMSPRPRLARGTFIPGKTLGEWREFGDLVLTPSSVDQYSWNTGGPHRLVYFGFNPHRFEALCQFGQGWDDADLNACLDIRSTEIKQTLLRLADEAKSPGFATGILVESLSATIIIELSRYLNRGKSHPISRAGKLSPRQLRQVRDYVEATSRGSPTASDLAALCGVSAGHLLRVYKKSTGCSLGQYVEAVRLKKAKNMLLNTHLQLKEISYRLGFAHPANFSTAFRRVEGVTPLEYRRLMSARRPVESDDAEIQIFD